MEAARFEPGGFDCPHCSTRFIYTTKTEESAAAQALVWHALEHPNHIPTEEFEL
jgi:hypothetical protein